MIEILKSAGEKRGGKVRKVIALTSIGAMGLFGAGCSGKTDTVNWSLKANCPEDASPEIMGIKDNSVLLTVKIGCGDGVAPPSVEVVSGPDKDSRSSSTDHNIELTFRDRNGGGIFGVEPMSLDSIYTDDQKGATNVNFSDADEITRAAVVGN